MIQFANEIWELEDLLTSAVEKLLARPEMSPAQAWELIRDMAENHRVFCMALAGTPLPPPQDVPLLISRYSPTSTRVGDSMVAHPAFVEVTGAARDERGRLLVTIAVGPMISPFWIFEIGLSGWSQEPPPAEGPPAEESWRQRPAQL